MGLNRSLGPHLCHFQLQSRAVAIFSYKVNLAIWEILTVESVFVRARYALNLAYFMYLILVSRFFNFLPWKQGLIRLALRTRGPCKDLVRVGGPTRRGSLA